MDKKIGILVAIISTAAFSLAGCSSGGYLTPYTPVQATASQTTSAYIPPVVTLVSISTTTSTPLTSTSQPQQTTNASIQMSNVGWTVTEVDSISYWHIAWKFTLTNPNSQPYRFDATIQYLDANGFEADTDYGWGLIVAANTTSDFTGSTIVAPNVGPKVSKVVINIGTPSLYVPTVVVQMSNVGWTVTQVDSINYWHIAWKFSLTNPNNLSYQFDATIQYLDTNGFEVDTDYGFSLVAPGNHSSDFTGSSILDPTIGPKVVKVVITIG